jgi:hypothetical protein
VVLLDTPVAREVCGPAACYVAPEDDAGLAPAITALLRDPRAREAALAHAAGVLGKYSWARAARESLGALESVRR